jgi:hypothetical protein
LDGRSDLREQESGEGSLSRAHFDHTLAAFAWVLQGGNYLARDIGVDEEILSERLLRFVDVGALAGSLVFSASYDGRAFACRAGARPKSTGRLSRGWKNVVG